MLPDSTAHGVVLHSATQPNTVDTAGAKTMKAMMNRSYGPLDGLALTEIDKPKIADNEVLVRVRAAGLHIGDCFGVCGSPFLMRLHSGLFKPKYGVPGFDVAGVVAEVGSGVSAFKIGDEVFGECDGACAEFAGVSESRLAKKPTNITFEQAAAVPTSALAALHALRDVAKVQAGQRLLINGASGGVGTYAVQLAKLFGAHVTAVCSGANESLMRELGADQIIDYTREDFTHSYNQYDVIFDNVENRDLTDCRKALKKDGMLILNSGTGASGLNMWVRLLKPLLLSPFVKQQLRRYLSVSNQKDLNHLSELLQSQTVIPVIDKVYPLEKTSQALEYIEGGHARGKVVVVLKN